MQYLTQILVRMLIIGAVLLSNSVQAKLNASIDRTDITVGETFVIDIRIDEDLDVQPDLSMIPKDFTIVSNNEFHHSQFFNGNRTTIKRWELKLKTLRPGTIRFPAIPVGNEFVPEFTLVIKDADEQVDIDGQQKVIFMESSIDQNAPYVQQQVIFTLSLYRAVNTHYGQLSELQVDNSIVEKLGNDVQYKKTIDNKHYDVIERRYAIFPQKSGELSINAINFTAEVSDSSQRNRGSFLNSTRPISISTKPIKLKVKPQPTNINDSWLPAQSLNLAEKWTPDINALKVGEPITWTLLVSVQGLSESQIPEISVPKIDGLQWHYDTPQKERQINEQGILSHRIEKIAVIPSQAGEITLPEIRLDWWDVTSNSQQTAVLPARKLTVLPADVVNNPSNIQAPSVIEPVAPLQTVNDPVNNDSWKWAFLAVLILWLLTFWAYWQKPRLKSQAKPVKHINVGQSETSHKELLEQIEASQHSKDYLTTEKALIQWLAKNGYSQITSLGKLIQQLTDETLKAKLHLLEASRYSAQQHEGQVSLTKSDCQQILHNLSTQQQVAACSTIPPLYPR